MSDSNPRAVHPPLQNPDVRYEPRDISVRGLVAFGVVFAVVAVVLHLVLIGIYRMFSADERSKDAPPLPVAAPVEPPGPRLEAYNGQALEQVRALENLHTQSYGWVDRKAGVARIPIDRAMDLYLERQKPPAKEAADAQRN